MFVKQKKKRITETAITVFYLIVNDSPFEFALKLKKIIVVTLK